MAYIFGIDIGICIQQHLYNCCLPLLGCIMKGGLEVLVKSLKTELLFKTFTYTFLSNHNIFHDNENLSFDFCCLFFFFQRTCTQTYQLGVRLEKYFTCSRCNPNKLTILLECQRTSKEQVG